MRRQLFIALLIAIVGILIAVVLLYVPPETEQQEDSAKPPPVQFISAKFERLRLDVRSQGRTMAQTEIDLVTGVSGNIIKVSPSFVSGGFFNKGDLLVAIDPAEYDLRVAQAQARVMEAQYQLTREEAEAEQARDEWQQLGQGKPNPLSLRIPQLKEKKAKLAAEQEELKNAKLLRQRTDIRAPFNGRVRSKDVGVGQYVDDGTILGKIYSSDMAEIRLPVSTQELAFIDFPDVPDPSFATAQTAVTLTAHYQGQSHTWMGKIVRSEGVVDFATGMLTLVAQVPDPFGLGANKKGTRNQRNGAILPMGLFVEATIEGRWFDDVMIVPESALLKDNRVAVIDEHDRLRLRAVTILRRERDRVIVQTGLHAGERILTAGLHHPVDGMAVTPVEPIQ
ncbi:efflux RND transporter periplasmic adaptor subunit [Nitrosomonas sp. JL21]|nr:efflux RND transporter periplasmic adaptor subunit [Nitrosomonas sp.]MXS78437.1 efflux RND transporter periplasmic adaptor subunit [Nitrosomonas sp. JL21]